MNSLSKIPKLVLFILFCGLLPSCAEDCYECTGASFGDADYCEETLGKTTVTLAIKDYENVHNGTCIKK